MTTRDSQKPPEAPAQAKAMASVTGSVAWPAHAQGDVFWKNRRKATCVVEVKEEIDRIVVEPRDANDVVVSVCFRHLDRYQAAVIKELVGELPAMAQEARENDFRARVAALMQALAPADPLAATRLKLAREDLLARREFFDRIPVLDSKGVAEQAGYSTRNAAQTAWRWREAGKIFSVNHEGTDYYPAFQFDANGQPLKVMPLLLVLFSQAKRSDWQNAFWFISGNGWLGGDAPMNRLNGSDEDVEAVIAAAERAIEPEVY